MVLSIQEERLTRLSPKVPNGRWVYRIFPKKFRSNPTGIGPGESRFSDNTNATYNILYIAGSFQTAFLEVLVRDRYVGLKKRRISMAVLDYYVCVKFRVNAELTLLDLRNDHCVRLGVSTATTRDRNHNAGQALGRFVRSYNTHNSGQIDGIMYCSRLGASDNTALFETGAPLPLTVIDGPSPITDHQWPLPDALRRYDLRIRR